MNLKIAVRDVGEVGVLELDGRLLLGEETKLFKEKVKGLFGAGKKKIVLNLANLGFIDSSGVATLVSAFHQARARRATLKLANVSPKIMEVLKTTRLTHVFDIYDTEELAAASFT